MKSFSFFFQVLTAMCLASLAGCYTWELKESAFFHSLPMEAPPERVEIRTADGVRLVGRFLRHPQPCATLVYYGGNAETATSSTDTLRKLSSPGLNVLMVDYRGYGASEGSPSLDTFFEDSLAVFRYAKNLPEARDLPLLLYGFSLGGFAAAHVAAQEPCGGLILEATGTNVTDWTALVVPWYAKPFVRLRIEPRLQQVNNVEKVRRFSGPLLVLGGKADKEAPVRMSKRLLEASPSALKVLHVFPEGRHGTIKADPDFEGVFSTFLARAGISPCLRTAHLPNQPSSQM